MRARSALTPFVLLWACTSQGPAIHLTIAHGASPDDRCFSEAGRAQDGTLFAAGITKLRLTVRAHGAPSPSTFLCDRVLSVPHEQPSLKLPLGSVQSVDLFAEGFAPSAAGDPQSAGGVRRVAVGSLLGVSVHSNAVAPLRLVPSERFRCVDARLKQARAFHSATPLPNGQVLVVGGLVASPTETGAEQVMDLLYGTGSAEIYDPATGQFQALAESHPRVRAFHQAALVRAQPPYQILLLGGLTTDDPARALVGQNTALDGSRLSPRDPRQSPQAPLPSHAAPAELITYDPDRRTITRATVDGYPAAAFSAFAQFDDGIASAAGVDYQVMGQDIAPKPVNLVAVQRGSDPLRTASLSVDGLGRLGATLTPLSADSALLWGGALMPSAAIGELVSGLSPGGTLSSAPLTGSDVVTQFHTASALSNGRVLVTGGFVVPPSDVATQPPPAAAAVRLITVAQSAATVGAAALAGGYVADPSCTNPNRYRPAGWEAATTLPSGKVLITGGAPTSIPGSCNDCEGEGSNGGLLCSLHQASLFSGSLGPTVEPMQVGRFGHTSTLLLDGTVLLVGGISQAMSGGAPRLLPDAELYNPRTSVPPYDATASAPVDADDPAAADLAAAMLARAPGGNAYRPTAPTLPVRECGEL